MAPYSYALWIDLLIPSNTTIKTKGANRRYRRNFKDGVKNSVVEALIKTTYETQRTHVIIQFTMEIMNLICNIRRKREVQFTQS